MTEFEYIIYCAVVIPIGFGLTQLVGVCIIYRKDIFKKKTNTWDDITTKSVAAIDRTEIE